MSKARAGGGLQKKILRLCVGIVLIAIVVFAVIGITGLNMLLGMMNKSSESQNQVIKDESDDLMWKLLYDEAFGAVDAAARATDGEFWTVQHDFEVLGSLVSDVFLHPENYKESPLELPQKGNSGKYVPQLAFAEWADQSDETSLSMARKLASLSHVMEEIIEGNDYYVMDCYISLPCGISIMVDDMSDEKINSDGTVKFYDATTREWYQGAVSTGKFYFTDVYSSFFHNTTELGYGLPIYADGQLVAVLHGSTKLDELQKVVSEITFGNTGYSILVSDEGKLIYSPKESGVLAMDEKLSKDIRKTSNQELNELIEYALLLDTAVTMVDIDGESNFAFYAPIKTIGWTQILFVADGEMDLVPQQMLNKIDEAKDAVFADYNDKFRKASILILCVMAALIALAVITAFVFSKKLVTPVDIMTKRLKDMDGEDIDFEMEPVYKTGDEIEVLATSFNSLTDKLKKYIEEVATISAEKKRIETELSLASEIQNSMLPRKFPAFPDRTEFDLFADMVPAKEVGGDFYDFYFIDDDHLVLTMGDVSGKGISAALFMAMCKHVLQNQMLIHNGDVEKAVEIANKLIMEENDARMFVTIWIGVLSLSTGHMVYVNAGHEYPIIYRDGAVFELYKDNHGAPLGAKKNVKIKLNEIDIGKGDVLYLYTDGITEANDVDRKMFGEERVVEVLNQNIGADMKTLDEAVRKAVNEFEGEAEQFDDMTSLALKLF